MPGKDVALSSRESETLRRLVSLSIADYYNPHEYFKWPESLPANQFWMSRDLLTTHCTSADKELSLQQLMDLSRWEAIHFFSLNVHGIRELLGRVVSRIHTNGFEQSSEFFHHFLREENDHMWFFAQFCNRYGGKIYAQRVLRGASKPWPLDVEVLLAFVRIELFEELVDHFNVRMASDEVLHPFIRDLNRIHHRDESRHIAFGRQTVSSLYQRVASRVDSSVLDQLSDYVARFVQATVASLYNPDVYRDAKLPGEPYAWRGRLLNDPGRAGIHATLVRRPVSFLRKIGVLRQEIFAS